MSLNQKTRLPAVFSALTARTGMRRTLVAFTLHDIVGMGLWLGIILWAYSVGGAGLAGVVAAVQSIPAALLSPVLASVGDSLARGTALVVGYLGMAAACALTALALWSNAPIWMVVAASSLLTCAIAVVRPFHFAALPQLAARPDQLASANALSSVLDGAALFIGPILAGIIVSSLGAWQLFALSTITCLVAAALCLGLGLRAHLATGEDSVDFTWREALAGLAAMWREWAALVLLLVMALRFLVAGAMDVLGVTFANSALGIGDSGAGLLLGALGIGQLVGGFVAATFAIRRHLSPVVLGGCVVMGLFTSALIVLVSLGPAAMSLVVVGIGMSILLVAGRTLLQRTSDERALARVFAVQEATALIGLALGSVLAPLLVSALGPAGAFVPLGLGVILLAVVGFMFFRVLDSRALWLPHETALLRGIPFLGMLRTYELERLAQSTEWVDVADGSVVVREGDPGDAFFVIDSGTFEVHISGRGLVTTLTAGQGFGELALLHAAPRAATVTAVGPGRLLRVGGHEFLAAVTGHPDGRALAAEVARSYANRVDQAAD